MSTDLLELAVAEAAASMRLCGQVISREEEAFILKYLRGELTDEAFLEGASALAKAPPAAPSPEAPTWPSRTLSTPA